MLVEISFNSVGRAFAYNARGHFENELPESDSGTTISGFADKKKQKHFFYPDRPILDFFLTYVSKHTYYFVWPYNAREVPNITN